MKTSTTTVVVIIIAVAVLCLACITGGAAFYIAALPVGTTTQESTTPVSTELPPSHEGGWVSNTENSDWSTPTPGPAMEPTPEPAVNTPATHGFIEHGTYNTNGPKYISLGFDLCQSISGDPTVKLDRRIIDVLKANGIHATFFVPALFAKEHSDDVKFLISEGYQIGAHTYDHPTNMYYQWRNGDNEFRKTLLDRQVKETLDVLNGFMPEGQTVEIYRLAAGNGGGYDENGLPNGEYDEKYLAEIASYGVDIVDWDTVSADAYSDNVQKIQNNVVDYVQGGSIVVMHANGHADKTHIALESIISDLQAEGYVFVTVEEMKNLIGLDAKYTFGSNSSKDLAGYPDIGMFAQPPSDAVQITALFSYYWPPLGGPNCSYFADGECLSKMSSGKRWQDFVGQAVACPPEYPFGTKVYAFNREWICMDRGSAIIKTSEGDWIDFLIPYAPMAFHESFEIYVVYP